MSISKKREKPMSIWIPFFATLWQLRPIFPRLQTYLYFVAAVLGFCTRTDQRGVTSMVRNLWLKPSSYHGFLRFFHCSSLEPGKLFDAWTKLVFILFEKTFVRSGERYLLVADGLKVPKEARKMPGVRSIHQESSNNSKPEWIMGHYFQAIGILVEGLGRIFAVPLSARIHAGLTVSNRDKYTVVDKLYLELLWLPIAKPFLLIADSYYCAHLGALLLKGCKCDLVSQVRINAVGRKEPAKKEKKGRGRPAKYGEKIKLVNLFSGPLTPAHLKAYGQESMSVSYWCEDLLWQQYGAKVRFVGSVLADGRRAILMSTDLTLTATEIIEIYALRMKIERSFKVSVRQLGAFAYHFWSKLMDRIKPRSKGQFVHKKPKEYREKMFEKLHSCERFVFTALVAQGLLQYLAVCHPALVWQNFNGWYRHLLTSVSPTEEIVQNTLRSHVSEILLGTFIDPAFSKFMDEKIEKSRLPDYYRSTA
jgi:hypothetical protein